MHFFETVSGFTTTGASILPGDKIEALSKSMLFWRSFTHWIGGMGVLVFILAILPRSEGQNIFLLKAESTGPQVGKLVSKIQFTARILYIIYFVLTIIEIIFLLCGGMPFFDSMVNSFATAGTGGFAILGDSIKGYHSVYSEVVIGIFMLLFGVNFNIFYLLLIGKWKDAWKSEELRWYFGIVFLSVVAIACNLLQTPIPGEENLYTFGMALKDSFFQVSSIITTTGFSTCDFTKWPAFSQVILFLLMFVGASAGSTGGGIKVSRIVILSKTIKREIRRIIHPNEVKEIHFESTAISERVTQGVSSYFFLIILIFSVAVLCISLDGFDFTTNVTAVASCLNNIGPGLGLVGPAGSFGDFSVFSKLVLIASMLIGRLEIYPFLVLFMPSVWRNR